MEKIFVLLPVLEMTEIERRNFITELPEDYFGVAPKILRRKKEESTAYMIYLVGVPLGTEAMWVRHFRVRGPLAYPLKESENLTAVRDMLNARIRLQI